MHGKLLLNNTVVPAKLDTQGYTPSAEGDIITKGYADAFYAGLIPVSGGPVQVATTGNVDLSPGNAPGTIDGYDLQDGDGLLVWQQTDAKENGIYYYDAGADSLVRRPDFDDNPDAEVRTNASVFVVLGDTHEGTTFFVSASDTDVSPNITLGTHTIIWSQYSKINLTAALGTKAGSGLFAQDGKLHLGGNLTEDVTITLAAEASDGERFRVLKNDGAIAFKVDNLETVVTGGTLKLGNATKNNVISITDSLVSVAPSDDVEFSAGANYAYLRYNSGTNDKLLNMNALRASITSQDGGSETRQTLEVNNGSVFLQAGGGSSSNNLELNLSRTGTLTFRNNLNGRGIEYAADYSANFTDRSLVDKEFVQQTILAGSHLEAVLNATDYSTYSDTFDSGGEAAYGDLKIRGNSKLESGYGVSNESGGVEYFDSFYGGYETNTGSSSLYGYLKRINDDSGATVFEYSTQIRAGAGDIEIRAHDITDSKTTQIYFNRNTNGIIVADQQSEIGIVYAADYSANYTARSLVDKAFVQQTILAGSHLEAVLNTTNYSSYGSTHSDGNAASGALRATTSVFDEHLLECAAGDLETYYTQLFVGEAVRLKAYGANYHPYDSEVAVAPESITLKYQQQADSSIVSQMRIYSGGIEIEDSVASKGMFYADDYSANFTVRSLVDRGWVENYVNTSVASALPTPRTDNRELTPASSSGNDSHDTGLTLAADPKGLVIVALTGNIRPVARNDAERASSEFYFADPVTPNVAKSFSNLAAGDKLMFNSTVGGYDLEANDRLDIIYI